MSEQSSLESKLNSDQAKEARDIAEHVTRRFGPRIAAVAIYAANFEKDGEQHPYILVLDKNEASDKKDLENTVQLAQEIPSAYRMRMQSRLGIMSCKYNDLFYFFYKKPNLFAKYADFFATLIDNAYRKGKQWDPVKKDFLATRA